VVKISFGLHTDLLTTLLMDDEGHLDANLH
jgi:hypothetical protein